MNENLHASLKLQLHRAIDEYRIQKSQFNKLDHLRFEDEFDLYIMPFIDACELVIAIQNELLKPVISCSCDTDHWNWSDQL